MQRDTDGTSVFIDLCVALASMPHTSAFVIVAALYEPPVRRFRSDVILGFIDERSIAGGTGQLIIAAPYLNALDNECGANDLDSTASRPHPPLSPTI